MIKHGDPKAKPGLRIHLVSMDSEDPNPIDSGLEGTIDRVDDLGTIHVNWDDGRRLGVIPGVDDYQILPTKEDQINPDEFEALFKEGSDFKVSSASKKNPAGRKASVNFKRAFSKVKPKPDIKIESGEVVGGEAEGMTTKDLANKHDVSVKDIEKEIKVGTEIEMEHTDSKKMAKEIAMDHIAEFPDYYTNKKHGVKASEKGLEKDLDETTTSGAAGAYNAPLFGKQTTVRKPKTKKLASNIVTKGDLKNPLGRIYSLTPKTESKIFKFKDLVNEVSSTQASKLRAAEGTFDGDPWVGKQGWLRKDELAWEGGEISDILAKMDINWNDSDLTLTDKQTDKINEAKTILKEIYVDPTPISVLLTMYIGSRLAGAKSKEVPQYLAELGGDLMIGFVKFMNKFGYSVDTDILKTKWDGLLKKALRKYYKEGGVLYPMLDDAEKRAKKRNKKSDPEVLDDIDLNEGWLFKTKEDKLVLNILKRIKERWPSDAKIMDYRSYRDREITDLPEWGNKVYFTLPGIERQAKIDVKCFNYSYDSGTGCYLSVNDRKLEASKWAIKKLYNYMFQKIYDEAKVKYDRLVQSDLTDPGYAEDVFDMLDDEDIVNEGKKKKEKESPIHKKKWERCVKDVKKQNKKDGKDYNPYAVCTASIGYEGSIKKPHRKKDKEEIEETTTFSSVFGGGFPVTPFMFAKKGKHIPSKKPIWKGGKIVQKTDKADLLGESLLDEINKVKWVKGGKFIKFKDRCVKYNNQPHCSQGAIDNPIELSDTAFENVKKISKKMNISEGEIIDKIKAKLRGVSKEQMEYNKEHGLPIWWQGSKEGFYEKMEPRKNNAGSN